MGTGLQTGYGQDRQKIEETTSRVMVYGLGVARMHGSRMVSRGDEMSTLGYRRVIRTLRKRNEADKGTNQMIKEWVSEDQGWPAANLNDLDDDEEPLAEEPPEECMHCGWKESQCICDAPGGDL